MEWVLGSVAALIGVYLLIRFMASEPRDRPVLPSHYNPDRYIIRHHPSKCERCGTVNEHGYRYCEHCANKLPDNVGQPRGKPDVESIFR